MTDKKPQTCYVPTELADYTISDKYDMVCCNAEKLNSVYIHTPEELAQAFRDVAEKAFQAGEKREYWNNEMEGDSCVPDMKEYLDQHYPLPQPVK